MKIAFCLMFGALMLTPAFASTQEVEPEPASIGPNGLNLGIMLNSSLGELVGLGSSGFMFGFGFAQNWRLDIGLSASARQSDIIQTMNVDTGEQVVESILTTSLSPSLALHRLIRASDHARTYVGLRTGAALHRSSALGAFVQSDSFSVGGLLGAEVVLVERLAVGIEAGLEAVVFLPEEERSSLSTTQWSTSTKGRLLVRYYF